MRYVLHMAKRVFFSFHYLDVANFRANVVRNHWVTKNGREDAGYFDASIWESAKKQGDIALKRLINGELDNTSNTCVLVGSETFERPWVRYEILKSFLRGNHIFAVHINGIRARDQSVAPRGSNPLEYVGVTYSKDGRTGTLWEKRGSKWVEYDRIDGTATFKTQADERRQGNVYNLSRFFPSYDWLQDDGYQNFGSWVV